jgi:hypothetical protein
LEPLELPERYNSGLCLTLPRQVLTSNAFF